MAFWNKFYILMTSRVSPGSTGGVPISGNADFQSAAPRIHSLIEKLHTSRQQLHTIWQTRKQSLEQCYQLRLFQQDANKVRYSKMLESTLSCNGRVFQRLCAFFEMYPYFYNLSLFSRNFVLNTTFWTIRQCCLFGLEIKARVWRIWWWWYTYVSPPQCGCAVPPNVDEPKWRYKLPKGLGGMSPPRFVWQISRLSSIRALFFFRTLQ